VLATDLAPALEPALILASIPEMAPSAD
jgi:hypothetical protein